MMTRAALFAITLAMCASSSLCAQQSQPVKLLFLGDKGHHRPEDRYRQIKPFLEKNGFDVVYTEKTDALNPKILSGFDGLIIYANTVKITDEQEAALLDFVAGGKGFIPIHCASYCFLNSAKYVELVGAQFKSHGTGTFTTKIAEPDHPIMKGYRSFESFDETYVHTRHNEKDRTVLEYRVDGKVKEPWTWVRTHGKGRVFYTAWGHDERTWGNAGFHDLLIRGIVWATQKGQVPAGQQSTRGPFPVPEMTPQRKDVKPFEYVDVGSKIPNYKGKGALSQMQKPLSPEESLKHLVLPKGFKAELFVSEPDIRRPICMTWDERGRLWVAESVDYPNSLQPPDKGNDRIIICEDTKGTGKADKFTVFADKLSIPTGMCFYNGGLLVFENRRTLFLKSAKDNDVADVREVLFTGWGLGDTHGGVSNMQYGLDNWIWAMQGYNSSKVTLGGETVAFRQGFFRFKPPAPEKLLRDYKDPQKEKEKSDAAYQAAKERYDSKLSFLNLETDKDKKREMEAELTFLEVELRKADTMRKVSDGWLKLYLKESGKLEFLRSTNNNTWGLGFSEEGLVFGSTANGNPSVYLPIPNRYYEAVKGWTPSLVLGGIADTYKFKAITNKVRQVDFHGGYTAAAGHALYTARNYPQEYWNRTAFVTEPTGHIVGTFVLRPDGSNFTSTNPFNLLASDDEWTAPIMAEVGPDGNVWVIDWYNYIVQHNPTPAGFKTGKGAAYDTDLRDKKHGRIYRIVPTPKPQGEVPRTLGMTLKDATPEKLIETLKHSNMFWRRHAQRLLVERGKLDVLPALFGLVRNHETDEIGLNVGAIHALWTMHGLGALGGKNKDATAVAIAALRHPSAGVRRNAVQVLPRIPESTAALLAAGLTEDADAQVRLAALLALADLPPSVKAGEAVVRVLQNPLNANDRWIPDAATCAAARNSEHFLKALAASAQTDRLNQQNPWADVIVVLPAQNATSKLTEEDALAVAKCKTVEAASPILATSGQIANNVGNWEPRNMLGVGLDYARVRNWTVASGEFFSQRDVDEAGRVCVVGQTIVKELFPDGDPIGQAVRIKQQTFRIVGVFKARGNDSLGQDQDNIVVMPISTVRKRLLGSTFTHVNAILARAAAPEQPGQAMQEINELLRTRRQIKPGDEADFEVCSPEIKKAQPATGMAPNPKLIAVAGIVAEHYARGGGGPTGPDVGKMGKIVAPNGVGEIIAKLADADPALAEAVVRGLARGWPKNNTPLLSDAEEKEILRLTLRLSPGPRAVLVQLASSWGVKGFEKIAAEIPRLLQAKLGNEKLSAAERIAAARELLEFQPGDKKLPSTLLELITPRTSPDLAAGLLRALQLSESPETGRLIVDKLPSLMPAGRAAGIAVLLSRPEWTAALLDRAEKGQLLLTDLSLDQKQALADHPSADLKRRAVDLLKKGGALPNADRQKVIDELLPLTKLKGDAAAGKVVFKNVCSKCHVHSGEGTRIGPDLTGVAVHTKEHLLIDIIDPSRSVEGNFRVYQITTTRGQFYTGLLASESKTAVELFDAEGKKLTILREAIDEMTALPKSLMPDGFEKLLKREELTDLLEFLTQRGKYLPLPLDKAATVVSTRGMFYSEDAKVERLIFPDWKPKVFEGVPFHLVDPQGERVPNAIMLYGPQGKLPPKMPKSVSLPCNSSAKAIHFLSGVSGWGYPYSTKKAVVMTVRLHYEDGKTEDHDLKNGEHFADYIRRVDVPGSKFAFDLDGRQMRYLVVHPKRADKIARIELVKGPDASAPVVMAVTVEGKE